MTLTDYARSPEWLALVAAVRDRPDDDLPRLVAADWLEERARTVECRTCSGGRVMMFAGCPTCKGFGYVSNGFADRGEFIRAQIAAARGCTCDAADVRCESCLYSDDDTVERIADNNPWWLALGVAAARRVATLRENDAGRLEVENGDVQIVFRRGFASQIRGPLVAFVEERDCSRCDGEREIMREVQVGTERTDCPSCHGTGRVWVPAPAFAELCRREPVERVEVTDREPWVDAYGDYDWWSEAARSVAVNDRSNLPASLWGAIRDGKKSQAYMVKSYPSRGLAHAALSWALVGAAIRHGGPR